MGFTCGRFPSSRSVSRPLTDKIRTRRQSGGILTAADLVARLSRVYAAVGGVFVADLSLFEPKVVESESGTYIVQDFSGGLNQAQLENLLLQVIHAIANLRDNVAKWADQRGVEFDPKAFVHASGELALVHDLSNGDKHGHPLKTSWTGHSPTVVEVSRSLRLTTGDTGEVAIATFGAGIPQLSGSGRAEVVVSGRVVDTETGVEIGDAAAICDAALAHWESQLTDLGLL